MFLMKKVAEHKVVDFVVGNKYFNTNRQSCICTAVADSFVKFTYNNIVSIKYPKKMFARSLRSVQVW